MGFFDRLKSGAAGLAGELKTQVSKFNNKEFADASMAICALVAYSDGSLSAEEKSKVVQFIGSSDNLKAFNVSELQGKFMQFCDKMQQDLDFGKLDLLQVVAKLKSKPDAASTAIKLALIIANADGNFSDAEKLMVTEIARSLNINPSEVM